MMEYKIADREKINKTDCPSWYTTLDLFDNTITYMGEYGEQYITPQNMM